MAPVSFPILKRTCSGDVHLAAVGRFYSNPKLEIPKDRDHRYMANIISSAIVNTPPPNNMADILNRRDRTHHLDHDTDEDMIPMFKHDVNGHPRNNRSLLPRRNWCSIREYHPGTTPAPSPPPSEPQTPSDESLPPPTRLQRTLSLTRGEMSPGNLIRRFSKSGPPPSDDYLREMRANRERAEKAGELSAPESPQDDGYFTRQAELPKRAATITGDRGLRHSSAPLPRPGGFHRRPTNMSEIAVTKGDVDENANLINLEYGLDIVLNCEINQKDPSGHTYPYRLIIPALYYEGQGDENTIPFRRKSLIRRLGSIRSKRRNTLADGQGQGEWGKGSVTPSGSEGEEEDARPRRWSFGISQRRQYRDQTPPLSRERLPDQDFGGEDTQQQRQFKHRHQQIGHSRPQPFKMPPSQQRNFPEPATPLAQTDAFAAGRQDSADYHAHLDSSSQAAASAAPTRRLSKVDRMLGVGNVQRSTSNGNGSAGLAMAGVHGNSGDAEYDDEGEDYDEYDEERRDEREGKRMTQGYSGIEAYSEKSGKGWRRLLGGKGMRKFG